MELHGIVGVSAPMQEVYDRITRFARSSVPLMITGETGTGKEMVVQAIRRMVGGTSPFVAVNCAAIPEALVESEIFGHERGAFTGATHRREGLLAQAHGGILFLDEVGELPLAAQAKLLRALEAGEYRAVGAVKDTRAHFRLITATNRDLDHMVAAGHFRPDLLHRLGTARIALPALRDRREDIPLLVEHFLELIAERGSAPVPCGISAEALGLCRAAPWSGNVRHLRNVIEAAAVHASGERVDVEHLRELLPITPSPSGGPLPLKEAMRLHESGIIQDALARSDGNREGAAVLLGISVATLYRRLAALQLPD
jgi:two-component system response regulator HydG